MEQNPGGQFMVIIVYISIILASVTQSATTKFFNKNSSNSAVFNAVKSCTALVLFALIAVFGFTFHLPTVLFGVLYGTCLCISMFAGYQALCRGPMALTSMLVSFSVMIPLIYGITVGNETLKKNTVSGTCPFASCYYTDKRG